MNKKLIFLPLSLLGIIAILLFGCDSDSDKSEEVCDVFPTPSECSTTTQATACCSDEDTCYYLYEGVKYTHTDQGLEELLAAMCPNLSEEESTAIYKKLNAQTKKLMEQARLSAVCQ